MDKIIFLIGFMGSGKSYWGRRLSEAAQCAFADLDARIEKREGCSVSTLFAERGEAVFRALEGSHLRILLDQEPPLIVATGGGTPCFYDNMAFMNRAGYTIWLDVPPEELARRLSPERAHRPLLAGIPEADLATAIADRLAARQPWYAQARFRLPWQDDEQLYYKSLVKLVHAL